MNLRAVGLVAEREIRERAATKTFKIGTALTMLIVVAGVVVPTLTTDDGNTPRAVGLVRPAPAELTGAITRVGAGEILVREFDTPEEGEQHLRDEDIALLVLPDKELVTRVAIDADTGNATAQLAAAVGNITTFFSALQRQGLDPQQASLVLDTPPLPIRGLEPAPESDTRQLAATTGAIVVVFIFLLIYGTWILNGVVEDKSPRVVEVLLSTMRPSELLTGKVLGVASVAAMQGVALILATLVAQLAVASEDASTVVTPTLAAYTVLWLIVGFVLYAWIYAAAAALTNRNQEAQNVSFPLQIPILTGYFISVNAVVSGPSTALTIASFVPFTAPMAMLARMAAGDAALWEVLLAIALSILAIYIVMRIAIVVFTGGILRTGKRVSVRQAWKNATT